jgi:hypothetical protein
VKPLPFHPDHQQQPNNKNSGKGFHIAHTSTGINHHNSSHANKQSYNVNTDTSSNNSSVLFNPVNGLLPNGQSQPAAAHVSIRITRESIETSNSASSRSGRNNNLGVVELTQQTGLRREISDGPPLNPSKPRHDLRGSIDLRGQIMSSNDQERLVLIPNAVHRVEDQQDGKQKEASAKNEKIHNTYYDEDESVGEEGAGRTSEDAAGNKYSNSYFQSEAEFREYRKQLFTELCSGMRYGSIFTPSEPLHFPVAAVCPLSSRTILASLFSPNNQSYVRADNTAVGFVYGHIHAPIDLSYTSSVQPSRLSINTQSGASSPLRVSGPPTPNSLKKSSPGSHRRALSNAACINYAQKALMEVSTPKGHTLSVLSAPNSCTSKAASTTIQPSSASSSRTTPASSHYRRLNPQNTSSGLTSFCRTNEQEFNSTAGQLTNPLSCRNLANSNVVQIMESESNGLHRRSGSMAASLQVMLNFKSSATTPNVALLDSIRARHTRTNSQIEPIMVTASEQSAEMIGCS